MTDLVDADAAQPVEQIDLAPRLVADAFADRAHAAPRDTHQLRDRRLGGVDRQPRRLILKRPREPRRMPGPRDRAHHDAVAPTRHPRRFSFQERLRAAEIQRTPAPPAVAEVKARATPATLAAAITLAPRRADRDDDLVLFADLHVFDDRALQAQQPRPYPGLAHAVSASLDSSPREAGTLGAARRAPSISPSHHPREQQERPKRPTGATETIWRSARRMRNRKRSVGRVGQASSGAGSPRECAVNASTR